MLGNINFLAVIAAGFAAFLLGALWYSPVLFGKLWQRELGYTDEYLQQGSMPKIFGTSFLLMLIMALGMAFLLQDKAGHGVDWLIGLKKGLKVGVFFVATSAGINYLYQRKSIALWLIDATYQVAFLGIMGAILGAWR
ncbi:MAG: DUF1761 domain-containing protein [Chitinophagales bacterium]|jgi:hypothetical protein|nr:DUF1761 domain-containing protein [Chitinophagales bacterium]